MLSLHSLLSLDGLSGAITIVFLLIILSYYILFLINNKKTEPVKRFSSITIIIPAHNEEKYIESCIRSVIDADFKGKKEVVVVDDGSIDQTNKIASSFKPKVTVLSTDHTGKADSLNTALRHAKGELIAVVDGDSIIRKDSLVKMATELGRKNVAAASCVVKVRNRKTFLGMWLHLEQLYNSLVRSVLSKVNANIVTPGPLSMYRKKELTDIGGFSTEGYSEDIDVTIRLIRKGYRVGFVESAVSETNMPIDVKGFLRQRSRFAAGILNILKRHLKLNKTVIDLYTLPIFLFSYIQAVVMGSITVYKIFSGYLTYFVANGDYISVSVLKFLFEWLSVVGFVRWTVSILTGQSPLTIVAAVGILSTLLSYPLFLMAIMKFDRKLDLWHAIPLFFMFPFWLLVMFIYILNIPQYFRKTQYNKWKKNE